MGETCGDFLIRRLSEWGVTRIYGYPGDGINGILGALERATDRVEFVQVRHEEMAAFLACAHAIFTGEVGVCLATSGPGAIHLLNGLYDAKMDHAPVLAKSDGTAHGGHPLEAHIRPTLEVVLVETPKRLERTMDSDNGLTLINVESARSASLR